MKIEFVMVHESRPVRSSQRLRPRRPPDPILEYAHPTGAASRFVIDTRKGLVWAL